MKKRRSVVMVSPGKDVTLYIPTDTSPEVIRYLNRLKAEGNFSQGIMEILTGHIVQQRPEAGASPFDEGDATWDDIQNESDVGFTDSPGAVYPSKAVPEIHKAFSPKDIIRQAARNAGKLLDERGNQNGE